MGGEALPWVDLERRRDAHVRGGPDGAPHEAAEVVLEGGAAKFGGRFGTITLALGLFLLPAMMSAAGFLVVRILGAAWRRRGGRGVVVAPAQGVPEAPGTAGAPPTVNPTR